MRRAFFFLGLLLSVVLLVGACAPTTASLPPTPQTSPSWAEFALEKYPLIGVNRPMSDAELVKLGLHRATLGVRTYFFNHYRGLCPKGQEPCGKWEWLEIGEEIAQDADGRAWYKTNCSNRLFEPVPARCPICQFVGWTPFGGPGGNAPWWLPWLLLSLLLLPFLVLLGWLYRRRHEPEPRRPGNGGGNGNGRLDPDLPGPAAFRPPVTPPKPAVDPAAVRRAALEGEIAEQTATAAVHEAKAKELRSQLDQAGDPDAGIAILGQVKAENEAAKAAREAAAEKQAELDSLGPATPPDADPVQELEGVLEDLDDPEKIKLVGELLQAVRQARYQGKGGKRIVKAVGHVREGNLSAVEADTAALLAIVK